MRLIWFLKTKIFAKLQSDKRNLQTLWKLDNFFRQCHFFVLKLTMLMLAVNTISPRKLPMIIVTCLGIPIKSRCVWQTYNFRPNLNYLWSYVKHSNESLMPYQTPRTRVKSFASSLFFSVFSVFDIWLQTCFWCLGVILWVAENTKFVKQELNSFLLPHHLQLLHNKRNWRVQPAGRNEKQ